MFLTDQLKTPDKRREIHVGTAVNLAAHSSCRYLLEEFAKGFVDKHYYYNVSACCNEVLTIHNSQSSIFRHFEVCQGVASDSSALLGDELTEALKTLEIKPPTDGSFLELYQLLSNSIHGSSWFRDNAGEVIVPFDLDLPAKRFLIRFLRANKMMVVVADINGTVRPPYPEEIETPEKRQKISV